jgi:hypothetical protein
VALSSTLTSVTDQNNTTSPLKLSTTAVQVLSPLRITTSDASGFYLDCEDSSTNNRFSIKRDPSSQEVTLDFASNPIGSTTLVGAIRTYQDGINLSNAMSFIEDGSVGIGTNAPVGILHLKTAAKNTRLAIDGDAGFNRLISYRTGGLQRFGLYVNNTAESGSNAGSNFAIRAYNDAGTLLSTPFFINRASGNVGIGTTTPTSKLTVFASGIHTTLGDSTASSLAYIKTIGSDFYIGSSSSSRFGFAANDAGLFMHLGINNIPLVVGTYNGTPLVFGTNNFETARFDVSGNFGIGTSSISAKLQIKGSGSTSATTSLLVQNSLGNNLLQIGDTGLAEFGTTGGGGGGGVNAGVFRGTYFNSFGDAYTVFQTSNANGNAFFYNNVSIGSGVTPVASAALDVVSTTKGFLPPRMTTAQKVTLAATATAGLMIYDTNLNKLCVYTGAGWETITSV